MNFGQATPVSDLMQKTVGMVEVGGNGSHKFFLQDAAGSHWFNDLAENVEVFAIRQTRVGVQFRLQAYHFPASIGCCCVMWALPPLLHKASDGVMDSAWLSKNLPAIFQVLEECGLSRGHFRPSRRSVLMKSAEHNVDISVTGLALQFHTLSTAGLLTLLSCWSFNPPRGHACMHAFLDAVIDAIVDRATCQGPFQIQYLDADITVLLRNGNINSDGFLTAGHQGLTFMVERIRRAKCARPGPFDFPCRSFLRALIEVIRRPSRSKSFPPDLARTFLVDTVLALQQQIAVSRGEAWWGEASCLELQPLACKKRRTQMSFACKLALMDAASSSGSDQLTPRQLLTAQSLSPDGKQGPSARGVVARIESDQVTRQLMAARMVYASPRVLHHTVDGVAASGEHNNFFVAYSDRGNYACVAPPQVPAD